MTQDEALRRTLEALEAAHVPHLLTGGIVVSFYAIPRFTHDADVVIQLQSATFAEFERRLPAELRLDPQVSFETITGSRRHVLNLAESDYRIELFVLGNEPHHQERFARRLRRFLPDPGCDAWISTAEDLIIQKLRWFRDKDRDDLRNILAVQGDALDFAHIHRWCDAHGTRGRLEEIQRSIPPI